MEGEPGPSIWASVRGWFTPAVLFVVLNLVIGTIIVTSKILRRAHHDRSDDLASASGDPRLSRVPSLGLNRLRSFGLSRLLSGEMPLYPSPGHQSEPPENDEVVAGEHHFDRSKSEPMEAAARPAERIIRKSASATSVFETGEAVRRPARAVRLPSAEEEEEGQEEVDARADDFINRFRQQLKLQRLNSILRYREMLNRGK